MRLPATRRTDLATGKDHAAASYQFYEETIETPLLDILIATIPYFMDPTARFHTRSPSPSLTAGRRTLLALMRTCRPLYHAGVPYLVKYYRSDGTPSQLAAFLGFLLANPTRRIAPLACLDWSTPYPGLRPRAWRFSIADEQPAFSLLADALERATWLDEVALPAGVLVHQPRAALALAQRCLHIRKARFRSESADDAGAVIELLKRAAWPLRELHLHAENAAVEPLLASLRHFAETLEEITLHGWQFDETEVTPEFSRVHTVRLVDCQGYHRALLARAFPSAVRLHVSGVLSALGERPALPYDQRWKVNSADLQLPMLSHLTGSLPIVASLAPRIPIECIDLHIDLDHPTFLPDIAVLMRSATPSTLNLTLQSFRFLNLREIASAWRLMSSVRELELSVAEDSFCLESDGAMLMAALFTESLPQDLAQLNITHLCLDPSALWRRCPLAPLHDSPPLMRDLARAVARANNTLECVSIKSAGRCSATCWRVIRNAEGGVELEETDAEMAGTDRFGFR